MKKSVSIILAITVLFAFAGCGAGELETENGTVYFENSADAYEAMTDAIAEGEYENAEIFYNSGAADSDDNASDWYYYALAKKEYEEFGCVGYPLDQLQNRLSYDFTEANEFTGEMQKLTRNLNGAYENTGVFLYLADGKIAVALGEAESEYIFTSSEIAIKDGVYYWVDRNSDGTHTYQYTIEVTEKGIYIEPTEDNTDDLYSGQYVISSSAIPVIYY